MNLYSYLGSTCSKKKKSWCYVNRLSVNATQEKFSNLSTPGCQQLTVWIIRCKIPRGMITFWTAGFFFTCLNREWWTAMKCSDSAMNALQLETCVPCEDFTGPAADVCSAGPLKGLPRQNNEGLKRTLKRNQTLFSYSSQWKSWK